MKYLTLKNIIIAVLAIALCFSLYKCNGKKDEITQLELANQKLDSTKNLYGKTILLQEVLKTSDKQAIKNLTDSIFALKRSEQRKVKDALAYYKSTLKAEIKEVEVPYVDVQARKQWEDSVERVCRTVIDYYEANTITVPRKAVDSTDQYKASLTATKTGIKIDSISAVDTQYIRFVTLKGGLLKRNQQGKLRLWLKPTVQAQVLHTSKIFTVTGQNSAIYVPPKKLRLVEKLLTAGGAIVGTLILTK